MNTDFKNSDDYLKLIQSQKDGLEEMSRHEPNCPKSGDIMEECTCPQQSTVEERDNSFEVVLSDEGTLMADFQKERTDAISEMFDNRDSVGIYPTSRFFYRLDKKVKELLHLAEQKAREEVLNSNEYKQLVEDAWKYNDLTK